jgi:c-di-GMP-binding flagellar brake protein YcgR
MGSFDEKRQYKRAFVKLRVEVRGRSFWQYVETRDISAGGMFVATDKVEPANAKIEVMFEFDEGGKEKKIIHAEGVVQWSRPAGTAEAAGMGIMFTKVFPSSGKEYIDRYVKNLEEQKNA